MKLDLPLDGFRPRRQRNHRSVDFSVVLYFAARPQLYLIDGLLEQRVLLLIVDYQLLRASCFRLDRLYGVKLGIRFLFAVVLLRLENVCTTFG